MSKLWNKIPSEKFILLQISSANDLIKVHQRVDYFTETAVEPIYLGIKFLHQDPKKSD